MKPPGRRCRCRHWALQAMILACASPGHALAQPPDIDTAGPARDAYLDETARLLVHGARHTRDTARLAIGSYTALIRERTGFVFPTFRRDRPWVSGERAARVRWSRDEPNVVQVLQARFHRTGPAPGRLRRAFPELQSQHLAADPGDHPACGGTGTWRGRS